MSDRTELDERIRVAKAHIQSTVYAGKLQHDPLGLVLESVDLGVDVMRDIMMHVGGVLARFAAMPAPTLSDRDVARIAAAARRQTARLSWHAALLANWKPLAIAAVVWSATVLLGMVGVHVYDGGFGGKPATTLAVVPTCGAQDGGVVCYVWTSPAKSAK